MHIHIQNEPTHIHQHEEISPADWAASGIAGHLVSFGETPEDFLAQAASVEILIAPPRLIKRLDLLAAPKLRLIQSSSAGVDGLQPFDRIPRHAILANNRGAHGEKAGEFALMAVLMLVNMIPRFMSDQRAGRWARKTCGLAARQRLTIIGLGSLGGAAAGHAKRLGMDVTGVSFSGAAHAGCARVVTPVRLDEILPQTDILLLACPLTPATENLLSAARIAQLPEGAGVINLGRGRLLDEAALFDALEAGRLSGAVLDVFTQEPLPTGHRAWGVRNLIITPHMSSDDPYTYNAATLEIFKTNLAAVENGETPPTAVDLAKGY